MKEKKQKVAKTPKEETAIVISQISLRPSQIQTLQQRTPEMYIKERPIRGGKTARYIEVGYVIAQLNLVFGAPNWEFEILEEKLETRGEKGKQEVWCKGKLTVIDHKNDYRVSKTQYGQHPVYAEVPLGDAFKAAGSDALKKCATMFGIGLDVYWGQLDELGAGQKKTRGDKENKIELSPEQKFETAKKLIASCRNTSQLIVIDEKIKESKIYSAEQKKELHSLISNQVDKIDVNANANT